MISFTVPSIITVNHYWGRARNGRQYLTQRAKDFRFDVAEAVRKALLKNPQSQMVGPLYISVIVRWPDKRIRDCDNILKPLLDAIEHTGLIKNDNQFKDYGLSDFDYTNPIEFEDRVVEKGQISVEIYSYVKSEDGWEIEWED